MIPTIETIVEDLAAGKITKAQAIAWLHQHAEDAYRTLRDDFAAAALQGLLASQDQASIRAALRDGHNQDTFARAAYVTADAMLDQRSKP